MACVGANAGVVRVLLDDGVEEDDCVEETGVDEGEVGELTASHRVPNTYYRKRHFGTEMVYHV